MNSDIDSNATRGPWCPSHAVFSRPVLYAWEVLSYGDLEFEALILYVDPQGSE